MNVPYVKQFDDSGAWINKVPEYISKFPNRRTRRMRPGRFIGNSKGPHLFVAQTKKFKRHLQVIILRNGSQKKIEHYL